MKKFLSLLLVISSLTVMILPMQIFAADTLTATLGAQNAQGASSCAVRVEIRIDDTTPVCAAVLKIKYDTALELLYVENGSFFAELQESPIYNQNAGANDGIYTYIGNHNMKSGEENVNMRRGTLLYMTFKIPDDAKEGDSYKIEVLKDGSELVKSLDDGNIQNVDFNVSSASVTVGSKSSCTDHSFVEKTVGPASYLTPGFSYKKCTVCGYTETAKEPAVEVDAFGYEGIAIRYCGNPSGIAATFTVDEEIIKKIEKAGYDVEIGTTAIYGDNTLTRVYYGEGATEAVKDGKIFSIVTGISVYQDVKMRAYITIKDKTSNRSRTEYLEATLRDKDTFSVQDVALLMNIEKYSDGSRSYLTSVINGYAD